MANRLTSQRKKCVKSANCFRDKQEYSSLYTISSHSASSIHSSEMVSQVSKQSPQNKMFHKGCQNYNGDNTTRTKQNGDAKSPSYIVDYNKLPKLPSEITEELQKRVYSHGYRDYYDDRAKYMKSKFDSLSLRTKSAHPNKPCSATCCPLHVNKFRVNTKNVATSVNMNKLEETYWAKWKPNKFENSENHRKFDRDLPPKQVLYCPLLQSSFSNNMQKRTSVQTRCYEDKNVEIIREPAVMCESHSSETTPEISTKIRKKRCKKKIVHNQCSTCSCRLPNSGDNKRRDEVNDNENSITNVNVEEEGVEDDKADHDTSVRFSGDFIIEEYVDDVQEDSDFFYEHREDENLDQLKQDTGSSLSVTNNENRNTDQTNPDESQQPETVDTTVQNYSSETEETTKNESDAVLEQSNFHEEEESKETNLQGSSSNQQQRDLRQLESNLTDEITPHLSASNEYSESEIITIKHTDSFIINSRKQIRGKKNESQPKFLKLTKNTAALGTPIVKGHTYPLKSAMKKEKQPPKTFVGFGRPSSPKIVLGSKQYLPKYLLRK